MKLKWLLLPPLLAAGFWAMPQNKKKLTLPQSHITLAFTNMVGSKLLHADSVYQNSFNEPFTVTQFKYYISHISFTDMAGKEAGIPNSYYLINQQDSSSKFLLLRTPLSNISAVNFFIGVDSIKNVSGVQTGALDPMNGMFWTWRTGYIMVKLEAVSELSNAPQQRVTYHIGGFQKPNNVVQKISLQLPEILKLNTDAKSQIDISADISKWFAGASDIKIADHNFCMNPGTLANKIAANYAAMFSVTCVSSH